MDDVAIIGVGLHIGSFDPYRLLDQPAELRGQPIASQLAAFQRVQQKWGGQTSDLDHLRQSIASRTGRQATQKLRRADHRTRMVKGSHRVLGALAVDRDLAAHGGIDHRQDRRRNGDPRHPTGPGCAGKPDRVEAVYFTSFVMQ